jgi:hypothetical protein
MIDPALLDAAVTGLGLRDLPDDPEAVALLPTVQAALGAALNALASLDTSAVAGEPDLDPSRAPRPPLV